MRIGIDASRAFVEAPTGTERYSREVIERIIKIPEASKHEWILYVKTGKVDLDISENVRIVEIPLRHLWTQVGLAARTWIDELDVLWVPAHTLPILRNLWVKTVVTVHGVEYEWLPAYENKLQRWYLPLSTKYAVGVADRIIAVSGFTASQLVERLGADSSKISVVYEGPGEEKPSEGNEEVFTKLGVKKKQYLLFLGTVQPRKNLRRLILAFSKLDNSKLKLVIAGKFGWGFEEVLEMPNKLGLKDKIIFTGYINEAERYLLLHYALLYVQPSITEGFGLPVLEAWKAGVPVVSSNGGALSEVVGEAGKLFDPLNVEEMSRVMGSVLSDLALRNKLVQKGRQRLKMFNWTRATKQTYNILTAV